MQSWLAGGYGEGLIGNPEAAAGKVDLNADIDLRFAVVREAKLLLHSLKMPSLQQHLQAASFKLLFMDGTSLAVEY